MSRTFALELKVSKNGEPLKTFSERIPNEGDGLSSLLNALHKTKEYSNDFLTTLVEADKQEPVDKGGVVISHSKRKLDDTEGKNLQQIYFSILIIFNTYI